MKTNDKTTQSVKKSLEDLEMIDAEFENRINLLREMAATDEAAKRRVLTERIKQKIEMNRSNIQELRKLGLKDSQIRTTLGLPGAGFALPSDWECRRLESGGTTDRPEDA